LARQRALFILTPPLGHARYFTFLPVTTRRRCPLPLGRLCGWPACPLPAPPCLGRPAEGGPFPCRPWASLPGFVPACARPGPPSPGPPFAAAWLRWMVWGGVVVGSVTCGSRCPGCGRARAGATGLGAGSHFLPAEAAGAGVGQARHLLPSSWLIWGPVDWRLLLLWPSEKLVDLGACAPPGADSIVRLLGGPPRKLVRPCDLAWGNDLVGVSYFPFRGPAAAKVPVGFGAGSCPRAWALGPLGQPRPAPTGAGRPLPPLPLTSLLLGR